MAVRYKIQFWAGILSMGVLMLILCLTHYYRLRQMEAQITWLTKEQQWLRQQYEHTRYINALAVEFSMDPKVVTLVDNYARQYVKKDDLAWRLVRTPEFMTYLMLSLIYVESRGNPHAIGDDGRARGLTQIWVSTAQGYGQVNADELLDPETNVSYAFEHFQYLLERYHGNVALALYAWNRGHGTVDRLVQYGERPENGYGKKVYEAALNNTRETILEYWQE